MNLSDCLKNQNFIQADLAAMNRSAKQYQAGGMSRQDAEVKAAKEMLAEYEREKADIERQILEKYLERGGKDGAMEAVLEREAIQLERDALDGFGDDLLNARTTNLDDFERWLDGDDNGQGRVSDKAEQASDQASAARDQQDAEPREAQAGDPGQAPGFVLQRPSPDDIRARDEQRAAAERAEQQPVSDPDEFVLTGSNRPADQSEARGQASLLDEPGAQKAQDSESVPTQKAADSADHAVKDGYPSHLKFLGDLQHGETVVMRDGTVGKLDLESEHGTAIFKPDAEDRLDLPLNYMYEPRRATQDDIDKWNARQTPEGKKAQKQIDMRRELDDLVTKFDRQKRINSSELAHATHLARELKLIDHWTDLAIKSPYNTQKQGADLLSAKVKSHPGAGTLSANPFFDPAVWAQAAKDAGHAMKVLTKALQDAYGWTAEHSGWVGDKMKELAAAMKKAADEGDGKRAAFGGFLVRNFRALLDDAGADMFAVAKRSGSKTMQDLVKRFHNVAADTTGQGETVSQRVEYEWNRMMSPVSKALDQVEALAKSAGRDVDQVMEQVANLVRNPRNIRKGNPIHDAADTIRTTLDEALKYMRDAGLEVGQVKDGYFPRQFDLVMAGRDAVEFEAALKRAYMDEGMDAKQADLAAKTLFDALMYRQTSLFEMANGKPEANFMEGRVFGKGVDNPSHPLNRFLVNDPRAIISDYLQKTVRRAETARALGGDSAENWASLRNQMVTEGARPEAIEKLAGYIQVIGGMRGGKGNPQLQGIVSWLRTIGAMSFLEKAAMTSLPEIIMPAIRSGNVLDAHKSVVTTFKHLFMKHGHDIKALDELADDLGLLNAHMSDTVMMNRWHGGDNATKTQTMLMDRHFKMTGLTQYTEATRLGALAVGQVFMRRLAKGTKGKLNTELMGELGIPEGKRDAFSKWLMGTNDGMPTAQDLRKAPPEMRALYTTAMRKFDSQTIMRPNQSTRPMWMNDHPFLGLLGQLQSYNYAFMNSVLKRNVKMGARALTGEGYTAAERMQMARPLLMMPLLAAMQGLVGEARDAIWGDPEKKQDLETKVLRAFSRGIPVAQLDPLINAWSGAKYQRSAVETVAGPVPGTIGSAADSYINYFQKNSEFTNTGERALAKNVYDTVIEPGLSVGLAFAFGNTPLYAQLGLAATRQAVGSGQTREQFMQHVAPGLQELRGEDVDPTGRKRKRQDDMVAF